MKKPKIVAVLFVLTITLPMLFSLVDTSLASAVADESSRLVPQGGSSDVDIIYPPEIPYYMRTQTSAPANLTLPEPELVILYDDGFYYEGIEWEDILWGQVDKIGIKRADLGRVGFESEYGCVLWYPLEFNKPLMFIAQRVWGKVGETLHNFYIQGNVAKTPFIRRTDDSWMIGWSGTITYNTLDFPVSVAIKMPKNEDRMYYKTNVTTPIGVDNIGIEYLLYANPFYADDIAHYANNLRLYFSNGTTKDFVIKGNNLDLTYAIPDSVANIGLVTDTGREVSKFDFSDVFDTANNKWLRIEQTTLPNGADTYVIRIGCAFGSLSSGETLIVDPATVGTSTTETATQYPNQRKTFYANTRHWYFYSDGANMTYQTSTDGLTWSGETDIRACAFGYRFSIWNNDTHVDYTCVVGDNATYRRGALNADGSITWTAAEQNAVPDTGVGALGVWYPSICVDGDGYPWIAYYAYDGIMNKDTNVTKSSLNNGTWTTDTGFPILLNAGDSDFPSIVPLNQNRTYVFYSKEWGLTGDHLHGRLWNGTAMGAEENIDLQATSMGYSYCAVAEGDDVHLVYENDHSVIVPPSTNIRFNYVKRTYGVGWGGATQLAYPNQHVYPVICLDEDNNQLFVFWTYDTSTYIYYRLYNGLTWETRVDWQTETNLKQNSLTCFYETTALELTLGVGWLTGAGSPFNIRYAFFTTGIETTDPESTSEPFHRKTFYANTRFWVWYSNGTNMVFKSSTDGELWSGETNVLVCDSGEKFSVWHNDTHVSYAYTPGTVDGSLSYRCGLLNAAGTISWLATEQTVYQNATCATLNPYVCYDSSGYPVISYRHTVYENFSAYTEVDTGNDRIQRSTMHIDFVSHRAEETYVYEDYGVNYFENFTQKVDARIVGGVWLGGVWGMSNVQDELLDCNPMIGVRFYGTTDRIYLTELNGTGAQFDDTSNFLTVDGTWYYFLIVKSGTSLSARIWTNAADRDNNDTAASSYADGLSLTLAANYKFRYVYGCSSWSLPPNLDTATFDIENLNLMETTCPYVAKSSLNDGAWSTASGFPYQLISTSDETWRTSTVPLSTSNRTYAVYARDGQQLLGKLWNSTAWETQQTVSSSNIITAEYHSVAVNSTDDVHLVFLNETSYSVTHVTRVNSTGVWGSETSVFSSANATSAPVISLCLASRLYCFWAGNGSIAGNDHVFYASYDGTSWGTEVDWIDESTDDLTAFDRLTCFYEEGNDHIGLMYMTNTTSPYKIKFNSLKCCLALNLRTVDTGSNVLTNAVVTINNGTQYSKTVDASGWANFTRQTLSLNVTISAEWYSVTVNSTSIIMDDDQTVDVACTAYPFNSATQHAASNATISSVTYASSIATIQFSGAVSTYKMVVDGSRPTYVVNATYNLSVDYITVLNVTHYANTTIKISYESWGNTYIQRVDDRLQTASWTAQKLRMYVNGTAGETGTMKIVCGSRGNPQTNFGYTTTSYNNTDTVFTGTYSFTSQVYSWVDWATPGGAPAGPGGGPTGTASNLIVNFPLQHLQMIFVERSTVATLAFVFDRSALIYLKDVIFEEHADWFTLEKTLPIRITKPEAGEKNVTISLTVYVAKGVELGLYRVPCSIVLLDGNVEHTVNSYLEFVLVEAAGIPQYMTYVFLGMLTIFLAGGFFYKRKKGRKH